MQWLDRLISNVEPGVEQVINDSKTPSGRVHVGALRGVLIHDAVYREMRRLGHSVRYMFGVDDLDPLDELPADLQDYYRPYLGQPLCNAPPPPGSRASDLGDHYISEFFGVFAELGVEAHTYRMRDVYRSGRFNDAIRTILEQADVVRKVYRETSGAVKPDDWYPFQVLCQNCGRVGTTEVYGFDGHMVRYRCRTDLVAWASGCGHEGAVSPFDGNGKLPWKLEWVAKWRTFGITIEGAGKDHTTKGGSRDVAAKCLMSIFRQEAPANIPYEFFLVGGSKMSSSRGVGVSAREIADMLPAPVLRFLILKAPPNRPVNFSPDHEQVVKLFNEYDRLRASALSTPSPDDEKGRLLRLCLVRATDDVPEFEPPFQLLTTLLQLPHIDVTDEIQRRKESLLTPVEHASLALRIRAAQYWLDHYADEDARFSIQQTAPSSIHRLSEAQRAFLVSFAKRLGGVTWTEESLQTLVFDSARLTPLAAKEAFAAIYSAFLGRASGPKAGSLLAYLEPSFVLDRISDLPYSRARFWDETSESLEDFETWLMANDASVSKFHFRLFTVSIDLPADADNTTGGLSGIGVAEVTYVDQGRMAIRRVRFSSIRTLGVEPQAEFDRFKHYAILYGEELAEKGRTLPAVSVDWLHEDLRQARLGVSRSQH